MITHNPLHRSGRARFAHPALALGHDAHSQQGIGMADFWTRKPLLNQPIHSLPSDSCLLASALEHMMPVSSHLESKTTHRRVVERYSIVTVMSSNNLTQPCPYFKDRIVHSSFQFDFYFFELGIHLRFDRLPYNHEVSVTSFLPADMRESKKTECLGSTLIPSLTIFVCKGTKLNKPGLLRVQLQAELLHSLLKLRQKAYGLRFLLESNHKIIRPSHDNHFTLSTRLTPLLNPQIQSVVKKNIRQQGRYTRTLWRPFFICSPLPFFHHACTQPFPDKSYDALVCYPVLYKLQQPCMVNPIEKATDVRIEHKVHMSPLKPNIERIQAFMLATPGAVSIRKPEKVCFINRIHHLHCGSLDYLIFQCSDSKWSLFTISLGYERSLDRLCSIRPSLESLRKIFEVFLPVLGVAPPRLPVHSRSCIPLQLEVGQLQGIQAIDMVHQGGELHFTTTHCDLTYPLQRNLHPLSTLHPSSVLLARIPFGQIPFLHRLRQLWTPRFPSVRTLLVCIRCFHLRARIAALLSRFNLSNVFVRQLRRYYGSVRFPVFVHHRRSSLDFPTRPIVFSTLGKHGTSRFSRGLSLYSLRVSDHVRSLRLSPLTKLKVLPTHLLTTLAPDLLLTRLNTWLIHSFTNASRLPSRTTAHSSSSVRVAYPLHRAALSSAYNPPVYPGAQGERNEYCKK